MIARPTLLLVLLGLAGPASAAEPAGPGLLEAVGRAPQLQAAARRIEAAQARTGAAGRLADPEVEAMGSRVNADAMGENRDMWELSVRQPLPKRGERAADLARAAAAVGLAEADFALTAGDLAAEVALALAEADGADARVALLETQIPRLHAALQSIDARLAAGLTPQIADRLAFQSRLAGMQLELEQLRRLAADQRALARGRLGLAPEAPLPAFAAPEVSEIDAADAATVAVARARIAEADAMGKVARAGANPMTSVGLRFERERSSMGNQDTVGLAVSSEIPWRTRRYARAEVRAAEADRAAATADADAARHRIAAAVSRVARAERVAAAARQLSAGTQARLDAEHEALSRSLGATRPGGGMAGDSAVLHAVDILDRSTALQIQILEAETAARTARAELWRYLPPRRLLPSVQN